MRIYKNAKILNMLLRFVRWLSGELVVLAKMVHVEGTASAALANQTAG